MPPRDDDSRLLDMLIAGRKIQRFVEGMSKEQFLADDRTQLAVLHCLEIIGEAASHVSEVRRSRLEMIPWEPITGLRNRIAHEYFAVNFDIIWDVLTEHLSMLVQILEGEVPPPDDDDDWAAGVTV